MFRTYIEKFYSLFSNSIGIDLGTANTLVYFHGRGIIINEPSVVAINQKTGRVVAVGKYAKEMLGRTPPHVITVRPLVEGVISDFEVTEEMIVYLLNKAQEHGKKLFGPRVVVGVPSGITNVETRAVRDAVRNAGAREVFLVEEPVAAAIGMHLSVKEPVGTMVIDIGGGTTDIAVISLGGIVVSRNVRIAGDNFDRDIVAYIRSEFKILIGEKTAEHIKKTIGSVTQGGETAEVPVRGRDLMTGLPREVVITDSDIREAISQSVESLLDAVKEVIEMTPPEILADIMRYGIHVAGGGALLRGLPELFSDWLKMSVYTADEPLFAVARGTGIIIENLDTYRDMLIPDEDDLPPKK